MSLCLLHAAFWVAALGAFSAPSALADVSYTETITAGGSLASGGGGQVEWQVRISQDRWRSDARGNGGSIQSLEKLAAVSPAEIVRLDKGRVYGLQLQDKTVTEETFEERRSRLARLIRERGTPMPFGDVSTSVQPTGSEQTISGYPCEEVLLTVRGTFELPASGRRIPGLLEGELWITTSFPGKSEIEGFRKRYSERLGLDPFAAQLAALIDVRYSEPLREFSKALSQVSGLPIKMTLALSGIRMASLGRLPGNDPDSVRFGAGKDTDSVALVLPEKRGGIVTRADVRGDPRFRHPQVSGDWTLVSEIGQIKAAAVDAATFEPPNEFRKLVPKARKQSLHAPASPPGGAPGGASGSPPPGPSAPPAPPGPRK